MKKRASKDTTGPTYDQIYLYLGIEKLYFNTALILNYSASQT